MATCSSCRASGHNRRRCPHLLKKKKKQAPSSRPPVTLFVGQNKKRSEHIVDLRQGSNPSLSWFDIAPHKDHKELEKEKRHVIDLAYLVRKANEKNSVAVPYKRQTEPKKQPVSLKPVQHKIRTQFVFKSFFPKIQLPEFSLPQFQLPKLHFRKTLVAFLLLLIVLPFPVNSYYQKLQNNSTRIVEESTNAFLALQSSTVAAFGSNIEQAKYDLNDALAYFTNAETIIEQEHGILAYAAGLIPVLGKHVTSRQHLLAAGHELALGNTYLVKGIDAAGALEEAAPFTDRLGILKNHLKSASVQYRTALEELAQVDPKVLPPEYQESFHDFQLLFAVFVNDLDDLSKLVNTIGQLFGANEFRRYLVVFQNHHEIRPTGGFLGSFAIVDVQKGKILNIDVPGGGTYDINGQLRTSVKPPLPLQLVNKRWEFQDANWFPDFAASAAKMEWFYEQGRGATVDGVIAINASVLERFLRVVGPIEAGEFGLLLDADTVLTQLQSETEVNYDKEKNQPKAVVGSVLTELLTGLSSIKRDELLLLLAELHDAASEKEIQVYVNDMSLQETIRSFGWTGEIVTTAPTQDYLMVVNTNLYGQKTDAKIEQSIVTDVFIEKDGSVVNTVTVKRKHTGIPGELFYGANNVNYMRVYVPEGSELLHATGFVYPPEAAFKVPESWYQTDPFLIALETDESIHAKTGTRITREFEKTVFGNWSQVEPGQETTVSFTYRLPFRVDRRVAAESTAGKIGAYVRGDKDDAYQYRVYVQKQSGVLSDFVLRLHAADSSVVWASNEYTRNQSDGSFVVDMPLRVDSGIGFLLLPDTSS